MNQEKETMQTASSASEYLSPKVKVVKIKAKMVMCTSGGTEDSTEESTDAWFNS